MLLASSPVWHFWIAVVLMITLVIPASITLVVAYLRKVQRLRYPKPGQDRA